MGNHLFVGPVDDPDKYRLIRQVGIGGEAVLWKAEVTLAGEPEPVAIKVLHAEHVGDPTWHQKWGEQATLLQLIKPDPGVVRAQPTSRVLQCMSVVDPSRMTEPCTS